MKKANLKMIFVIDESGSMAGSESDVIGGFNGYVEKQRSDNPGTVLVSLYKFSDRVHRLVSNKPIGKISLLTDNDYEPGGFTALYDAIGCAIRDADKEISGVDVEGRPDKVLMVIMTDGQENASKEFSSTAIRALLATHESMLGWDVVFLGADLSDLGDAEAIGVTHKVNSRKANLKSNFDTMAEYSVRYCMRQVDDVNGLVEDLGK
jgi:uncharacterized protein YegL